MPELKTKLKEYRAKLDMKQGDLAEKVSVRRETIIRLEKGQYNPSLKLAMDIAKVFGVFFHLKMNKAENTVKQTVCRILVQKKSIYLKCKYRHISTYSSVDR